MESQAWSIREARPEDQAVLGAFNLAMAHEAEGLALDPDTLSRGLNAVLGDPARGFYLVAEADGEVIGQLMITYEWSDWRCGFFFWIQSVYVAPAWRRRGVYRALYREIERRAASRADVCGIRLAVARDNLKAKATYTALGMIPSPYEMYEVDFHHGTHVSRAHLGRKEGE